MIHRAQQLLGHLEWLYFDGGRCNAQVRNVSRELLCRWTCLRIYGKGRVYGWAHDQRARWPPPCIPKQTWIQPSWIQSGRACSQRYNWSRSLVKGLSLRQYTGTIANSVYHLAQTCRAVPWNACHLQKLSRLLHPGSFQFGFYTSSTWVDWRHKSAI